MHDDGRRYQLLEQLGEGGFGVVYRARLQAAHGFSKDVAVKVLRPDVPPASVARFRDEARILGLLSDRAIVAADAPVKLDEGWALVMEFVDGIDLAELVHRGPLPAGVAVEIVGEVARALAVARNTLGPDGEPLGLLHRDLKPANLRLTPSGQVKILDFGVARAAFEAREVKTTQHISGTPAYIAPERLQGHELPAGDIYSLGIVLHELVVGERPGSAAAQATFDDVREAEAIDEVLTLASHMRAEHPHDRPTAEEVEVVCETLRRQLPGPSLRRWSAGHIQTAVGRGTPVDRQLSNPTVSDWRVRPVWMIAAVGLAALAGLWLAMRSQRPAATLEESLQQPLLHFVMEPSAAVSERTKLRRTVEWDPSLVSMVHVSLARFASTSNGWRRLDQVVDRYAEVVSQARERGLPEVVAGVPWVESRYTPEVQSNQCAKGLWQFMPETADMVGLRVEDCIFEDGTLFTAGVSPARSYLNVEGCRIPKRMGCAVDERSDVRRSTVGALSLFQEVWEDPVLRGSGLAVPLLLASHHTGFDHEGPNAVKPMLLAFEAEYGDERLPHFFTIEPTICKSMDGCTGDGDLQTGPHAWYAAQAIAAHLAAVCFYGANYPERDAFAPWTRYEALYCAHLDVPTREQVAVPQ